MTKHTPTPWKLGGFGVIYSGESPTTDPVLDPGHYRPICKMDDWKNQQEDAAYIVRAVNTHEDFLRIAKALIDDLGAPDPLRHAARKAIAKAEGR